MTDEELKRLKDEARALAPQLIYVTMEGHAERAAKHTELRAQIDAEETRRRSLSGLDLAERQLADAQEMLATNRRMAEAAELSARSSAEAARWAKWAAIATAVGTIGSIVAGALFR